uniref:Long-chain-fatty-acid--CoA ligase n=1 Tax=Oryzias sinensis TaxID=183150 RepID=A0A8C8E3A3_9TELE
MLTLNTICGNNGVNEEYLYILSTCLFLCFQWFNIGDDFFFLDPSHICTMDFIFHLLFSPLPIPIIFSLIALGVATLFYLSSRPNPISSPVDLHCQTVVCSLLQDGARKTALLEDNNNLTSYYYSDARTLYEIFQRGLKVSGNGPCLGHRKPGRPYQWLKYKQVSDRAEHLGSGLLQKGLKPNTNTFFGIFAQNRPEWIIGELACYTYSMVVVPLYDTLGPEALVFIINRAEISTVLCDDQKKAETLLQNREKGETSVLKLIIIMDSFNPELFERGAKCGVEIMSLEDIEDVLRIFLSQQPPKPEDLSVICFTSGTTGDPKGAMITHENIVADLAGVIKIFESSFVPSTQDISISFLPLAHMFERITAVYGAGARVGFYQGDIRLLPDDMKTLQPTIFPVVPRLLNRIYDKVQSGAKSPFQKWLLNFAVDRKYAEVQEGIIRKNSIWDKLIFNKVQESLGGRVRLMVTGAAPISPAVLKFLRAALGCQIFEGYGQTECAAACTFTMPGDATTGHVGMPLPCNYMKLVDVEEMSYFASNGEGESGVLKIIDRKKNIFKLAQGEYIAPEKIENVYVRSEAVAQVFVHGDSLQSYLVAIVVPDADVLPGFAKKLGHQGSIEELCKNSEIKKAIISDMTKLGREAGLKSFEQVKDVYLHPEMFTIENGLLTPTLKAKRAELKALFLSQIDQLYAKIQ